MSKGKKLDINQMLLNAHKLGVKMAIDTAARTNTPLVVSENGKVKLIRPKYKYVRVPIQKKKPTLSKKKK